jgi:Protein of unknown function (DUF1236)
MLAVTLAGQPEDGCIQRTGGGKMRKHTLMISTAALALAMSGGLATAQNTGGGASRGGEAPAASGSATGGGSGMSAPSARGGADSGGATSGAAESRGGDASGGMRAQEGAGSKASPHEAQDNKSGNMNQRSSSENKGETRGDKAASDTKGEMKGDKAASDTKGEMKGDKAASDTKSGAEGRTTGSAATAAKAAPPAEKRTQITSAIKQEKVTAVTNVNFNVAVGTRVPASVRFYPVPASVVTLYPEWRGYQFILVGSRYIIVEPETHEIVYIIDA